MRSFVTGATGFLGSCLARELRGRGEDMVALVRSPEKAGSLRDLGCELVAGDLGDDDAIRQGVAGCDAAFHVAGVYKVGIPASQRPAMFGANVRGTERVLDAAMEAGVGRIVYVSTIGAFGNTHGQVVDETYERPPGEWLSAYDESKYLAHVAATDRIAAGAPISIAQPGGIYGPGDTSELSTLIERIRRGRMPFMVYPEVGFNFVHVEDAAHGLVLIRNKGKGGESYVLGGELTTMGDLFRTIARLSGRKAPRFTLPSAMAKMSIPLAPVVTRLAGLPPNLREMIRAADGVTYWATDEKARRELGYAPRDLETGMRQTLEATG
jgi:nucleoside-diphosphate-sugar epimerase